jgi:hypothetical protein
VVRLADDAEGGVVPMTPAWVLVPGMPLEAELRVRRGVVERLAREQRDDQDDR